MEVVKEFLRNEDGVTAVEYGLIAALIAGVIVTVFTAFGTAWRVLHEYC